MTSFRVRIQRQSLAMLVACVSSTSMATAWPAPVGDALERPAVISQQTPHAVLLGAAQAGQRLVAVGERGIVVISDDGGTRWRQVATPVSITLTAVRFADAKHGYAVGHGGTVLATDDGGETWERRLDGRRAADLALAAARNRGDAAALREAERLVADGPDKPFLDLLLLDAQHAVVVGAYGLAFATNDGGKTWAPWIERLDNPQGLHLYAIRRQGEHLLIVGEQGLIRLSKDGGQTFTQVQTPYPGSFFTAEFITPNDIVVAGLLGNVWRTQDAGTNWTQMTVPVPASITASALRPDGALVLVNQAGLVLGERNGTLVPLSAPPLPPLNSILPKQDGTFLTLGIHGASLVPTGDHK
ncbi:BNR domain-containing protein [Pseudomonas sp. JV551A1]|uniref:BNR domain-containing protein n=1 Tax=Pseudomonas inefficax TaxID=2078786 RepID=A0AAQ1PAI7_9PSED|nr:MULTISPECIES: YCF48-related protein [Pseudomonas]SPO54645.1 BNR domain-containing protein [Pseudomonas sp. JV551A1]SPO62075.1 BNR domain-containing protein [Pseudomonas inefficax]